MLAALCLSMLPVGVPVANAAGPVSCPPGQASDGTCIPSGESTAAGGAAQKPVDGIGCSIGGFVTSTNVMAICVSNLVYYIMIGVFSSIAYICAFFFDLAVQLSLQSTTYALDFISSSWTVVRDLANMAFIFTLLYIAITLMLEAETGETMKTLVLVVLIALLVNFSFFFTRITIDAGNLLAVQFYNTIQSKMISETSATGLAANNLSAVSSITSAASGGQTKDLTYAIMNGLQVQNLVNTDSFQAYTKDKDSSSMFILISLSTIYIMMGVMFAILAGAFLYAGSKFMIRIVALWFVIIFSPLAFVAMVIKPSRGLFWKWARHMVNFSFYPAVFLFMFLILTKFVTALNANGNFLSGIFAGASTGGTFVGGGFVAILTAIANVAVRMGFIMAMMYLALSAADMVFRNNGDISSPWAKAAAGWMGNMVAGGAVGAIGRQTLGRVGRWTGSDKLASATFDPRNIKGVRSTITPLLGGFKGTTGSFSGINGLPVSFGGPGSAKDIAKAANERAKERDKEKREADNAKRDKETKEVIQRVAKAGPGGGTQKDLDRIKNLNKREIESLKGAEVEGIIHAMSDSQLKTLTDSSEFSDKQKEKFRLDWHEKSNDAPMQKAQRIVKNELRTLSTNISTPHIKAALATVNANSAAGHHLKGQSVTDMRDEVNDQIAQARSDIRTAPPGATTKALQKDLATLQNSLESLKRLGEERVKVPVNAGGQPNAGEFTVAA